MEAEALVSCTGQTVDVCISDAQALSMGDKGSSNSPSRGDNLVIDRANINAHQRSHSLAILIEPY